MLHRAIKCAGFLSIILAAIIVRAQPLADKVPGDALVYIAWTGTEQMPEGYQASHLKGLLDSTHMDQMIQEFIPRVMKQIGAQDQKAAEVGRLVSAVGGPMWRHPSALYFGGIDFPAERGKPPIPHLAVLCKAGPEAAALSEELNGIITRAGQMPFPVKVSTHGDLVALTVGGKPSLDEWLGGLPAPALSARKEFTETIGSLRKNPVAAVYIDAEAIVKLIDEAAATQGGARGAQKWATVKDILGVSGLKRIAWTAGFDGKDWASEAVAQAPAPRKGLMALIDAKPIAAETYAAIPKGATSAGVGRLDFAGVFSGIRSAVKSADPRSARQFDDGMRQVNQQLGMNVEKDLLEPLGDEWAWYVDPAIGGNGLLGLSLVNRLDNAARVETALTKLEGFANAMMAGAMRNEKVKFSFRQLKTDSGLTIHYIGLPVVTPAWAVKDGNLYVALYPQVVVAAADYVTKKGPSILANEKFAALRARLGGQNATAFSFMDLPETAADGYQTLLALSRLYLGLADMVGMEAPPMIPPPLGQITPHLSPAASVQWVDDAGWHQKSVTPFPGAIVVGQGGIAAALVGQNALLASIMLPALNRSRETANRVKCASNMRQIGQGMLLYSNENKGNLPPDLGTILKTQDITIEVFVCPSSDNEIPANIRSAPVDQQAAWVNGNSNYVYMGKGLKNTAPAEQIVMYEKFEDHSNDGINMLFGDGHVEFNAMPQAQKLLQDQKAKQGPRDGEL